MQHNVIEPESPLVYTIGLTVYGEMNNLSLATAIYNWYMENRHCFDDIELEAVINLLGLQLESDERRWKNAH